MGFIQQQCWTITGFFHPQGHRMKEGGEPVVVDCSREPPFNSLPDILLVRLGFQLFLFAFLEVVLA